MLSARAATGDSRCIAFGSPSSEPTILSSRATLRIEERELEAGGLSPAFLARILLADWLEAVHIACCDVG